MDAETLAIFGAKIQICLKKEEILSWKFKMRQFWRDFQLLCQILVNHKDLNIVDKKSWISIFFLISLISFNFETYKNPKWSEFWSQFYPNFSWINMGLRYISYFNTQCLKINKNVSFEFSRQKIIFIQLPILLIFEFSRQKLSVFNFFKHLNFRAKNCPNCIISFNC